MGISLYSTCGAPYSTVSFAEYVRARVKNVHDRKKTRVNNKNPDAVFKVKNLEVKDFYL